MITNDNKNEQNFTCKKCDYVTSKKYNFERHIKSKKHICSKMITKTSKNEQTTFLDKNLYVNIGTDHKQCEGCGKKYKYNSGISRHRNICIILNNGTNYLANNTNNTNNNNNNEIIHTLINENKKLQDKVMELASQPRIINHTNNNQKTFNVIQFLNHDCKDAMNLSDFIKNLVVTFDDIEKIEEHGYLKSVKNSLMHSLHMMEQNKRPIHCTDTKRKQFYVKDENVWNKDVDQSQINKVFLDYNNFQLVKFSEWKKENPDWISDGKKQDKVNKITKELTSLYSDKNDKLKQKLLNDIIDVTAIDK